MINLIKKENAKIKISLNYFIIFLILSIIVLYGNKISKTNPRRGIDIHSNPADSRLRDVRAARSLDCLSG